MQLLDFLFIRDKVPMKQWKFVVFYHWDVLLKGAVTDVKEVLWIDLYSIEFVDEAFNGLKLILGKFECKISTPRKKDYFMQRGFQSGFENFVEENLRKIESVNWFRVSVAESCGLPLSSLIRVIVLKKDWSKNPLWVWAQVMALPNKVQPLLPL
jgi:hypothetical protein